MGRKCSTCEHPERQQIELALANTRARIAGGVQQVAQKYGIPRTSLRWHMDKHMTQEQVARLRFGFPDSIQVSIEEITKQEGEGAMLGFRRLRLELEEIARRADAAADFPNAIRARTEQKRIYEEQLKLAAMYPGRKQTVNNNLVIGDGAAIFQMMARILEKSETVQEARLQLSAEFQAMARAKLPAIEARVE